jgi:hypothetical protein
MVGRVLGVSTTFGRDVSTMLRRRSVNDLAIRLGEAGRRTQAVAAAQEAGLALPASPTGSTDRSTTTSHVRNGSLLA